jgi:glucose/arabinose dehydrogenase
MPDGSDGSDDAATRHPRRRLGPDPNPPKPVMSFEAHAGANGVDFSRTVAFGFEGDAFVALFGDLAPVTTPRQVVPAGFKVVRVDMRARRVVDFAVNKIAGPASKLPHDGFERPSHCAFGPDSALYVVDWGEIQIAPEAGGVRMKAGTGALWRIRRTGGPAGERAPEPMRVPFYPLQYLALDAGAAGLSAAAVWLLRRWRRTRRRGLWGRVRQAARRR